MSTNIEKWRLDVSTKEAQSALQGFEKRLSGMFDASAAKVAVFNKALDLGVAALRAVGASFKQGFDDALLFQRTTQQLSFTLRQLGDSGLSWLPKLQNIASETQRLTGVSDEVSRSLINMALNSGVSTDRLDDLMKAAVRLSNTYDMSLNTAVVQLVKSQTGLVTQTLKATGAFEGMTKEELMAGKAIDVVNEKLESQLEVLTGGTAGGQMALTSAWADFNEELFSSAANSDTLQGALNGVADSLNSITRAMASGDLVTQFAKFAEVSSRLSAAILTVGLSEVSGAGGALGDLVDEQILDRQASGELDLVGLGAPAVGGGAGVNGKGKGGGKPKGWKGKSGIATYEGKGEGFVDDQGLGGLADAFASRSMGQEELDAINEKNAKILELEQQVNEGLNDIYTSNLAVREKITTEAVDKQIAETKRQAEESARWMQKGASMALGAMNAFVEGGALGAIEYATAQLQGVGMEMIGRGIADSAKATAMMATVVDAPRGIALAAAAADEIAVGTALTVGGFGASLGIQAATGKMDNWSALTGKNGGAGGGGGGGSSGGSSGDTQGRLGQGGGYSGGSDEPKTITVILQGPVYDGAAAGVAITEAIAEAKRQGF